MNDIRFCNRCPFLLSMRGSLFAYPRYDKDLKDTERWLKIKDNLEIENKCGVSKYYFGKDNEFGDLSYQLLDNGLNPKRKMGCLKLAKHVINQYNPEQRREKTTKIKILHLSDLHIHKNNSHPDNLIAIKVVDFITNHYAGQEIVIIITGDITDDGRENQYANADKILTPLVANFKVLCCPGNHDYGPLGNFYSDESRNLFGVFFCSDSDGFPTQHHIDDVMLIGLDSVIGNENEFLHFASGEVGASQREKLQRLLEDNKSKRKIVYFHHHPFNRNPLIEMDDAKEVMGLLANQTDFVCFGHKHDSELWSGEHGIPHILSSGKTTEKNALDKMQFREITIDDSCDKISTITF